MNPGATRARPACEARFEGRPEGQHKRRLEMMSPDFGTVYLSGGRYVGENGPEEELRLRLTTPAENWAPLSTAATAPVTGTRLCGPINSILIE